MYVAEPRVSLNKILPEKTESKTEEQKQNNEAKAIAHGRSKRKISNEAKPRTENDSRNVLKYQAMIASNLLNKCYPNNQDYQSLDELYKRLSLSWPLKILSQDNASAMDDISKFYFINKLPPEVARYVMTLQSSLKDDFIDITEDGLVWLSALWMM
ncbi:hypothetical protein BGW37DRAFT_515976 [Umbelopsis sp. PMI_123]|nr:hypothetical protein BGW37DRAFT_515976 [Umbelopsis sp. PMI_123]